MPQALVEHCAREDRPEAVEAAVMHMDIASLDLNQVGLPSSHSPLCHHYYKRPRAGAVQRLTWDDGQVVRLCRQHHLYSALAFLFPRALLDFVAPAAELVVAVAYASDEPSTAAGDPDSLAAWSERRQLAFKLLVYLRTCFQGLSFPPGKRWPPAETPVTPVRSSASAPDARCIQLSSSVDCHSSSASACSIISALMLQTEGQRVRQLVCLQGAGCWTPGRCQTPGLTCWASCCTAPRSSWSGCCRRLGRTSLWGLLPPWRSCCPGRTLSCAA